MVDLAPARQAARRAVTSILACMLVACLGQSSVAHASVQTSGIPNAMPRFPEIPLIPVNSDQTLFVAVQSGRWDDSSTWQNMQGGQRTVPGPGDSIRIPQGIAVVLASVEPQLQAGQANGWYGLRYVRVEGTLSIDGQRTTELVFDTMYIAEGGVVCVGGAAPGERVAADETCRLTIMPRVKPNQEPAPIRSIWDPQEVGRGIICDGALRLYGEVRSHLVVLDHDVMAGDTQLTTMDMATFSGTHRWKSGDSAVVLGTHFHRGASAAEPLTDDVVTLDIQNGQLVDTGGLVAHDHERALDRSVTPATPFNLYLAHLERNVVVASGWERIMGTPPPARFATRTRGHLMIRRPGGSAPEPCALQYVRFDGLGRTDKGVPLDDIKLAVETTPAGINSGDCLSDPDPGISSHSVDVAGAPGATQSWIPANRRGRYPVHFHRRGYEDASSSQPAPDQVEGCVITGTPGWGFVNHSSHVDFVDCICHDFVGAGFVTEAGDELGSFSGCVAVHGTGPEHGPGEDSTYFFGRQAFCGWRAVAYDGVNETHLSEPHWRPQPISDFAFAGDGFWFQGPLVSATNNVANSCSGAGMFWFTCGAVDDYSPLRIGARERYAGFRRGDLEAVYGPVIANEIAAMYDPRHPCFTAGARSWGWSQVQGPSCSAAPDPDDQVILADLPIREMSGFEASACLVGFRIRFSNSNSDPFFREAPFYYWEDYVPRNYHPGNRVFQEIVDLRLWNNEQGLKARYVESTHWSNVVIANEIAGVDWRQSRIAAELNHSVQEHVLHDVFVSGYAVGLLLQQLDTAPVNALDNSSQVRVFKGGVEVFDEYVDLEHVAVEGRIFSRATGASPDARFPEASPYIADSRGLNAGYAPLVIDGAGLSVHSPPGSAVGEYGLTWDAQPVPDYCLQASSPLQVHDSFCMTESPGVARFPTRYLVRFTADAGPVEERNFQYYLHTPVVGTAQPSTPVIPGLVHLGGGASTDYVVQVIADYTATIHPMIPVLGNQPRPFPGPMTSWSEPAVVTVH